MVLGGDCRALRLEVSRRDSGVGDQGSGFRVEGLGFTNFCPRVAGLGFGLQGLWFRVEDCESSFQLQGFTVFGLR